MWGDGVRKEVLCELGHERCLGVDQRDAILRKVDEKILDKSLRHGRAWSCVVPLLSPQDMAQCWHLRCAQ